MKNNFKEGDFIYLESRTDSRWKYVAILKNIKDLSTYASFCYTTNKLEFDTVFNYNKLTNPYDIRLANILDEKRDLLSELDKSHKIWVPHKKSIESIHPFDKVLLRSLDTLPWEAGLYGRYSKDEGLYHGIGCYHEHCIPYEEELLGKCY